MKRQDAVDVVVETSGGTVVALYSSDPKARVILVDWDEFEDEGRPGVFFPLDSMSQMPADTRRLVNLGLHES
jgi:hypothetical protein